MFRRLFAAIACLGLGAGLLAACGDSGAEGEGTTTTAANVPAAIRVASDIPYAPFEFFEKPGSRKAVGFDVDLVNEAAKIIGIGKVTFVDQGFDSLFISIPQGRFDLAASSITITEERQKDAIFSDPYFSANQSIMVKKGSAIATEADLEGKTLGVQRGTTGADYARKIPGAKLKRYEEIDDAFVALETGRVDAVINDFAISAYATKSRTGLEVVSQITTNESYGLMFPKESTDLRDQFNTALEQMRGDGTYDRIYRKWFGEAPPG
jgi:ABC-type amino acid transport substrate-binding protein